MTPKQGFFRYPGESCAGCALSARLICLLVVVVLLFACGSNLAQAAEKLPARFREWLEHDVAYIISDNEKKAFLALKSDDERDKFIQEFWEARNPNPGSPINEFKEEHYRRIQYANAHFGNEWNAEGWRSDRGRIYIILGPPASHQSFPAGGEMYPIELWFYNSDEPSLPPFFYVMFYQKQGMSDYRLYSPYVDGPDKLVRVSGSENNRLGAYRFLYDFNPELARASLTLIPSEPADINSPPSLTSDGMLMKIVNIANDKFHKERIETRRRLREQISYRITYDLPAMEATVLPLRNSSGEDFINYSLQIAEPQNYSMGRVKDKYYLDVEVQVRLLNAQKKLVYETTREAVAYYTENDLAQVKGRALDFDDRLAVVPGDYELEFTMLNRVDRVYSRTAASVKVEALPVAALTLGKLALVQKCLPSRGSDEPFNFGGARCNLLARHELLPGANANLNLLYPVYLDPASVSASDEPLKVTYTIGRLDRSVKNRVTEDTLDRKRFDRYGELMVGKSLSLAELPTGPYLLALQVTDPVNHHTVSATLPFKLGGPTVPPPNVLTPAELVQDASSGNDDFRRGMCSLDQNAPEKAMNFFSRALQLNPKHQRARFQLASLYYARGDYDQAASLLEAGGITKMTDLDTVLKLLASLEKAGKLRHAIETAEQAVALLQPTPQLYETLASLYDHDGQSARAQQAREEARKLSTPARQTKSEKK